MTNHTVRAGGLAVNALVRTVLQGLAVVAVVAGWAAARDAMGADGPIDWTGVAKVAGQAAGMAVLAYGLRAARTGRAQPVSWELDKWVRTGRTLASGLGVTVAIAAYQAVSVATTDKAFDFHTVSQAVITAAGMAVAAYVHRLADRTPLPTAVPPAPEPAPDATPPTAWTYQVVADPAPGAAYDQDDSAYTQDASAYTQDASKTSGETGGDGP